jgi:hypothetical protein
MVRRIETPPVSTRSTLSIKDTEILNEYAAAIDALESGVVAGGASAICIAAANTPAGLLAAAQHVCDGTDDHDTINTAIDSLYTSVSGESVTGGSFILVDDCNDPITNGWTAAQGDENLSKEDSIVFRGSALKIVPGSTDLPGATLGSLSLNVSTYKFVDFRARCAKNAKLKVVLNDGSATTLLWHTMTAADEWERVRIPIAYAYKSDADLTAITSISIHAVVDNPDSDHVLYLDEVGFSNPASLANNLVDFGTVSVSGHTESTDYDVDYKTGRIWAALAGGIMSAASLTVDYDHGGGEVQLLPGKYGIGTTDGDAINPRSNLTLTCENGVVLSADGSTNYSIGDAVIKSPTTGLCTFRLQGSALIQGYRDTWQPAQCVRGIVLLNCHEVSIDGSFRIEDFNGPGFAAYRSGTTDLIHDLYVGRDFTVKRCSPLWVDEPQVFYNQTAGTSSYKSAVYLEGHKHFEVHSRILDAPGDATYVDMCQDGELHFVVRKCAMGGFFVYRSQRIYVPDLVVDGAGSRGVSIETDCEDVLLADPMVRNSGREAAWLNECARSGIIGGYLDDSGLRGSYGGSTGGGPTGDDVALIRFSGTGNNNYVCNAQLRCDTNEVVYRMNTGQTLVRLTGNHVIGTYTTLIAANVDVTYSHIPGFSGVIDYEPDDTLLPTDGVILYRDGTSLKIKYKSGGTVSTGTIQSDFTA